MDAHDPVARVLFILLRDNLPVGVLAQAVERARAVQRELPDTTLARIASEIAEDIRSLSTSETTSRS